MDFNKRPLSWSAISQFQYNPEIWYDKYILGKRTPENAAMFFGKLVGDRLRLEPNYLPQIERPEGGVYEYELRFKVGSIPVVGFIDFFHKDRRLLKEFKTGRTWEKERAERHGQLKLYALGLMITEDIKPEDLNIHLVSMETTESGDFTMQFVKEMKPVVHEVKLTTKDCLLFGAELIKIVKGMEEFIHLRINEDDSIIKEINNN